jgi:hypothetical protein
VIESCCTAGATSSPSRVDGWYWEETVDDGLFEKATVRESPAEKRKANLKLSPALALPTLPDAVPYVEYYSINDRFLIYTAASIKSRATCGYAH